MKHLYLCLKIEGGLYVGKDHKGKNRVVKSIENAQLLPLDLPEEEKATLMYKYQKEYYGKQVEFVRVQSKPIRREVSEDEA